MHRKTDNRGRANRPRWRCSGAGSVGLAILAASCAAPDAEEGGRRRGSEGVERAEATDGGSGGTPFFPSGELEGVGPVGGGLDLTQREDDAGTCLDEVTEGEQLPMDMFIMFDISLSMNQSVGDSTRMEVVRQALVEFLNDPASAGVGTGIGYFPAVDPNAPVQCQSDDQCGDFGPCRPAFFFGSCDGGFLNLLNPCTCVGADICDVNVYAQPAVPITLPPNPQPVVGSLLSAVPNGFTPLRDALDGAHRYAASWAEQHPERKTVVVLVGDGVPQGCGNTNNIANSENVVRTALNGPFQIPTFVVGVGPALDDLNRVAAAGGTGQAYLMSDDEAGTRFKEAMEDIRGRAIPCDVLIPADQDIDPDRVNIDFIPRGGAEPVEVLRTHDGRESSCDPTEGGWYYDDPSNPTQITMCPATCANMERGGRRLSVKLGCESKTQPPR